MFCLAAGILLLPSAAQAQARTDPRTDAQVHVGPFYLTPRVAVEELGIDTNVFNTVDEKRDFTFTLAPHVDVWVPFARRGLLTTAVTTDVVYYRIYSSERSFNPDVRLRGELLFNRLTLFAEPSYLRSRERFNYEIDARARREEEGLGIGADIRVSQKLSAEVAVSRSDLHFDAAAVFDGTSLHETLNRDSRGGSVTIRDALTPFTTLELRAEAEALRFDLSPVRNADSFAVLPGVVLNPRALISGSASVGYRRFRPLRDLMPRFDGVVANAALGYTLLGITQFRFTALRDIAYSYSPTQPYYLIDGYGLTVRHYLGGRFDVTGGVERHQYAYRDLVPPGTAPAVADSGPVDVMRAFTASVGYRFGRTARLGVGAAYRQRRSVSDRFNDYDGLRFVSTIDYGL